MGCLPGNVGEGDDLTDILESISIISRLRVENRHTRRALQVETKTRCQRRALVFGPMSSPQVALRALTPSPSPVPNCLMKPALAMMEPPAPSYPFISRRRHRHRKICSYLKTLTYVAGVDGEHDQDDTPEDPQGARKGQFIKPRLHQTVTLVAIDVGSTDNPRIVELDMGCRWSCLGLGLGHPVILC